MVRMMIIILIIKNKLFFFFFFFLDSLEITAVAFVVVNNNCSILAVGWDKHINVFNDDREQIKQICYPDDQFCNGNEQTDGHKEDILCIDKSQGDLIATGDYGGTIIVSNLSSRMVFVTLKDKNQNSFQRKITKDFLSICFFEINILL